MAERRKRTYTYTTEGEAKRERLVQAARRGAECTEPKETEDGKWTFTCTFPPLGGGGSAGAGPSDSSPSDSNVEFLGGGGSMGD